MITSRELYSGNYEDIVRVLKWISPESVFEFLRQFVFSLLSGNGDAHLKNFSLLYKSPREAILSPAYDLVATVIYFPQSKQEMALKLFGVQQFSDVNRQHIIRLGLEGGLDSITAEALVTESIELTRNAWESKSVRMEYSEQQRQRLQLHFNSVLNQLST
jgi:serine/threonine-protein kinase HipA